MVESGFSTRILFSLHCLFASHSLMRPNGIWSRLRNIRYWRIYTADDFPQLCWRYFRSSIHTHPAPVCSSPAWNCWCSCCSSHWRQLSPRLVRGRTPECRSEDSRTKLTHHRPSVCPSCFRTSAEWRWIPGHTSSGFWWSSYCSRRKHQIAANRHCHQFCLVVEKRLPELKAKNRNRKLYFCPQSQKFDIIL